MKNVYKFIGNLLNGLFRLLADLVNNAERSFLDFISALVPYAVPVIPAYLTFQHTQEQMGFDAWIAWTAAFVVEALGIAAVDTAIKFYYHNLRYKDSKNHAPFKLAAMVYLFYITVVVVVNVVLEIVAGYRSGWVIFSIALFALLSIPSGVLIAIRAQYSTVLENINKRYSGSNNSPAPSPASGTYRPKPASAYHDQIIKMLDVEYSKSNKVLTPKQITSRLKLDHSHSKGYVSTLTKTWKAGKGIN